MKRCLRTFLLAIIATIVGEVGLSADAWAQGTGYASPTFYGNSAAPAAMPPLPASPLAGGYPAADGGYYMDAHGQSIVMPASYCQGCPPGGGYCGGYGDGGGDPMAVDFGGYACDQHGPHYFDVAAGVVYLEPDNFFADVAPFTAVGLGNVNDLQLDPTGQADEYKPGWEIAVRYDIGPLAVLEATYMGLYDFGFQEGIVSTDPNDGANALFSVFSNYGLNAALVAALPETEMAAEHQISWQSDLQSTEISYRRYWVGHDTCTSGTYLLGARYVRFTEDFQFLGRSISAGTGTVDFESENDLVGFQLGGDGWLSVMQGARFGCEGKAGVYNNRFKFDTSDTLDAAAPGAVDGDGNQVSFVGEGSAQVVIDILPSWSLRGGYRVMYISSLVMVGENINTNMFSASAAVPELATQGHALYHGFNAGLEYIW